ncbi:hypothetical protein DM800_02595 [Bacillus sp. AY18-3]|nr:hypothetical protein E0D84_28160 [Bacillus wiedmannii]TXR69642.1 hypothetical protein DM800_02595 [Bacillus sp. AY18-3]
MNVGWPIPTCLLAFTCTDCCSKTEDMRLVAEKRCNRKIFNVLSPHACRSCENQAKVSSVQDTYVLTVGTTGRAC